MCADYLMSVVEGISFTFWRLCENWCHDMSGFIDDDVNVGRASDEEEEEGLVRGPDRIRPMFDASRMRLYMSRGKLRVFCPHPSLMPETPGFALISPRSTSILP